MQYAAAKLAIDITRVSRNCRVRILTRPLQLTIFVEVEPAAPRARNGEIAVGANGLVIVIRRAVSVAKPLLSARAARERRARSRERGSIHVDRCAGRA